MKETKTCPKCGGSHILRVEDGVDSTGISLYLGILSRVPVTRYVCIGCGYTESWVDQQFLGELKERYEWDNRK